MTVFLVPVFDGDHLNITSPPVLLQKVLSDLQAETQQRLKEREQELKNLKKVMEVTKVSRQSFILQKSQILTNPCQPLPLSLHSGLQLKFIVTQSRL